jgi:hypothetical protein
VIIGTIDKATSTPWSWLLIIVSLASASDRLGQDFLNLTEPGTFLLNETMSALLKPSGQFEPAERIERVEGFSNKAFWRFQWLIITMSSSPVGVRRVA